MQRRVFYSSYARDFICPLYSNLNNLYSNLNLFLSSNSLILHCISGEIKEYSFEYLVFVI